jgi:hypothetical protein
MSIKRISRRRVAAPIIEYVDEAMLTTNNTRTGGDVETKINPPMQSGDGGDTQSRAGTNVETRTSTEVGKNAPTVNRWSV